MDEFDIPIFKKTYDLYVKLHDYRKVIPKHDRLTVFERCEQALLDVIEELLRASTERQKEKLPTLKRASLKLNLLRVLVRLLRDIKAIDIKKYASLESDIEEIGKMLGGWTRFMKER